MDGELFVTTSETVIRKGTKLPFLSAMVYVDKDGKVFRSSSIEIEMDGERTLLALEPEQVRYLLMVLGLTDEKRA